MPSNWDNAMPPNRQPGREAGLQGGVGPRRLVTSLAPSSPATPTRGLARQLGPGPSCLPEARDDGWGCHSQT